MKGAGRLDRKRLLASSSVFLSVLPSLCDVVVMFAPSATEDDVQKVLSSLRDGTSGLEFKLYQNPGTKEYFLYVIGEDFHDVRDAIMAKQGKRFFDEDTSVDFRNLSGEQRCSMIREMLVSVTVGEGESYHGMRLFGGEALIPNLVSKGLISQIFPLHCSSDLKVLENIWIKAWGQPQPLDKVKEYFGIKIALYFSWLGHYTWALVFPAIAGLFMWFYTKQGECLGDIAFLLFSLFNAVWTTLYLSSWKQRSTEMTFRWGTLDMAPDLIQPPRPLFRGEPRKSPITGIFEPFYPSWKRNVTRYCLTLPVTVVCLSFLCLVVLWLHRFQESVDDLVEEDGWPSVIAYFPKILLAITLSILDEGYRKIAKWLNDLENHRLQHEHQNQLALKLTFFQCCTAFFAPFYLAFYHRDMVKLRQLLGALLITRQVVGNIKEIAVPFLQGTARIYHSGYKMTSHLSPSSIDGLESRMKEHLRGRIESVRHRVSSASPKRREGIRGSSPVGSDSDDQREPRTRQPPAKSQPVLTQAEVEASMKRYEDTFEDCLEMLIQFGYVTMFSPVFPLAAVCALLNNVVEVRSDAAKLCWSFQRPFPDRVPGLGIWVQLFEAMAVLGIMVNSGLILASGVTSRLVPYIDAVWTLLAVEHALLGLKFLMTMSLPVVPAWIAAERTKLEYKRRKATAKRASFVQFAESPS